MLYSIGIDVGGTSIKWGLVDRKGQVTATESIPTIKDEKPEETVKRMCDAILSFLWKNSVGRNDIIGVGVGCPGQINSETGIVTYSNNLKWENFDLVKEMEELLAIPVKITNDANAAALGEVKFGSGKNYKNAIVITLGTGVGGGIIVNGKLVEGNQGAGAEIGHMVIELTNPVPCTCGRRGCLESYASATALIRQTKEAMLRDKKSKMWELVGGDIDKVNGKTCFDGKELGDKTAIEVVENYVRYLGEGILNFCNIFRPEAVILSGGIAKQGQSFVDMLVKYCEDQDYGYKNSPKVEILLAHLGYDAGIVGAASLLLE